MFERRQETRRSVDVFFNKFLQGYPYLCRAIDVSTRGVLVETYSEPAVHTDRFPVELRLPEDKETLWLWARRVRREGSREALEFVSMSAPARNRIRRFLGTTNESIPSGV